MNLHLADSSGAFSKRGARFTGGGKGSAGFRGASVPVRHRGDGYWHRFVIQARAGVANRRIVRNAGGNTSVEHSRDCAVGPYH